MAELSEGARKDAVDQAALQRRRGCVSPGPAEWMPSPRCWPAGVEVGWERLPSQHHQPSR